MPERTFGVSTCDFNSLWLDLSKLQPQSYI